MEGSSDSDSYDESSESEGVGQDKQPRYNFSEDETAQTLEDIRSMVSPHDDSEENVGEVEDLNKDLQSLNSQSQPIQPIQPSQAQSQPQQDYWKLTVVLLKELCKNRGLPRSGKKADLVSKLEQFDAGEFAGTPLSQEWKAAEELPLQRSVHPFTISP